MSKMFIGTRAVYNGGNSKNITIPKSILNVFVNPKVHHLSIEKYTTLSKKNYCSFSHFSVSLNR